MITKSQIKYLQNLQKKKYRLQEKKFLLEGIRIIQEALDANFPLKIIFITNKVQSNKSIKKIINLSHKKNIQVEITSNISLEHISDTQHHQGIIAVADLPNYTNPIYDNQILALYKISDPGNLGTLLRTAEWFGIKTVLLSENCVDPFNPKVVRSSMGAHCWLNSILQVKMHKKLELLQSQDYSLICADLNGHPIKEVNINNLNKWVLLIGGETKCIPNLIKKRINHLVCIYGKGNIDSLNAAIAGGILLEKLSTTN